MKDCLKKLAEAQEIIMTWKPRKFFKKKEVVSTVIL
jgi:hypothetical protein